MLLEVLRIYGWGRVAILTSSENVWQLTSHSISTYFKDANITVAYFATFDPGHNSVSGRKETEHMTLVEEACSVARSMYTFFC